MTEYSNIALSICMPTRNRADILHDTLSALVQNIDAGVEIVVSNNCSSDHTVEILTRFAGSWPNFRHVTQTVEIPRCDNFYAAFRLGRGKYLYQLHDDDRLEYAAIRRTVEFLEDHPAVVGAFGGHLEWERNSDDILGTFPLVDEVRIFEKSQKQEIIREFKVLWSPVIRREIYQRFCSYDKYTWGQWPLVGKMLDHGSVALLPEIFYKHAHTVPRTEHELTEGWYHDMYRAQFEEYIGELGCGRMNNAFFISNCTAPAYLMGVQFAQEKQEWATARNYIIRARAYGLVDDRLLNDWERRFLHLVVVDRLKRMVSITPGVKTIVFENHAVCSRIAEIFAQTVPDIEIAVVEKGAIFNRPTSADEFVVAWDYETLTGRVVETGEDPLSQHALKDLFESSSLTKLPISLLIAGTADDTVRPGPELGIQE